MATQRSIFDPDPPAPKRSRAYHVHGGHATAEEHAAGTARAETQMDRVVTFFRERKGERFTPWQVSAALGIHIVSCRRAISNATRDGLLLHHRADRRPGPMGEKCGTWEAA